MRRWIFLICLALCQLSFADGGHPYYVSVLTIEHNASEKRLEISVRIFTDDLEKTLRNTTKAKVDLLDTKMQDDMNNLLKAYLQQHVALKLEGVGYSFDYLGYQKDEEAVLAFLEINEVERVQKLEVMDDILYEYKKEQNQVIHVTVNGKRKSTKLTNPDAQASFSF